ncbi:hypothetical protein WMY93_025484 [Mugilogobius chulae]|uniref:EF-hand calcium-binding domain-containing protein 7 n=1 Tax=Mugilogobius chulae TaxID=88201 RepID=A0AAW0N841_9GOBI
MSIYDSPLRPTGENEAFYTQCRAAYLSVFKSSLTNISSKQQLCHVLQQAGRNPSQATLNKYWSHRTSKLNFDDFCEILKNEKKTDEQELLKAFRKLDTNHDGYISHSELEKALTNRGEKMTTEEINAIFSIADINKDGKLDYTEFCRLFASTVEQCQTAAMERLEADVKQKKQNFGSQPYSPPKNMGTSLSSGESQALETPRSDADSAAKKESQPSSRPSSARSRRSSLSSVFTMTSSSSKVSKVQEPANLQDWQHSFVKGCFFVEADRTITSLQYQLHLPQTTEVYLTIQPVALSNRPDKSNWLSTDTALFIMTAGESKEDSTLVGFTESKHKNKYLWRGEMKAGTYHLLPFSSGCRLTKSNKKTGLFINPKSLEVLSDVFEMIDLDGNGLLSLDEYNFFELRTSGEKCDKDAWAVCKENFDMMNNQLTKQGFMELNLMEATEKDGDPTDLWATLEAMGYNRMLELLEACPFQIDIFCESAQPVLHPICLDSRTKLLHQAIHKSITSNQKVTVHINNEQSRNCCSSRGMNVFAIEITGRTKMVCQHVLPINEKLDWTYNCTESILPGIH